jgi:hypothetical protein
VYIAVALALPLGALPAFSAGMAPVATVSAVRSQMSVEEIVAGLARNNEQRFAALHAYEGKRSYTLIYRGFPSDREAAMEVVAHYEAPESKSFDVVSGNGSKLMQSKVFAKLLEVEREAADAEDQRQTALSSDNYSFTLLGTRPSPYGGCYRLAVEPRKDNKYLYRGEICVNAADFAVESIDAELAKNPSFWIKKTHIEHRYQKIGQFWLPASNQTVTSVRLGGTATLNILYTGYELH